MPDTSALSQVPTGTAPRAFRGPLFLVGMPRSGTKLLRGLLGGHSRMGIPDAETEFLPQWVERWSGWGDLADRANFSRFYGAVTRSAYFTYLLEEQGRRVGEDEWYAACRGFDVARVFEALVRLDGGVGPEGVWGDKSPGYLVHLPLVWSLWPEARVVHLVRDVRDYCLSMHKAWNKHMLRAAQRWTDRVERARIDAAAHPDRYLEVRYEDLLAEPRIVLERVCAFLDLAFEPAMLDLARSTENLGDARGQVGIKRDNTGKYATAMEPGVRARIERVAGPTLRSLGYPVRYGGPARRVPAPLMLAWQVRDGAWLVRSDVALRGWVGALRFRLHLFRETGTWERLSRRKR